VPIRHSDLFFELFASDGYRAPVDLAQKIGDIVGDHIDDVKRNA
jgi:hypothetical protein